MKVSLLSATTLLAITVLASLPLSASATTRRPPATPAAAQQDRATSPTAEKERARKCNAEADGKKLSADARKKFVANCLKAR